MNDLSPLRAIVGEQGFITHADDMAPYLTDWRKRWQGQAQAVIRPANTAELSAVMAWCYQHEVPMVPQGGNTGLAGAATPDDSGKAVVIQLGRMRSIRALDPDNQVLIAEAGCILSELQQAAASVDRYLPLSLGAEGSCQIGGNLATNAGGLAVLKYGNARDLVLGLEVVLPDGTVWDGLSQLRKNNAGYDLKHLFMGSEGTLGIISAAVLKLYPAIRERVTALLAIEDAAQAVPLLHQVQAQLGDQVTSFELMPRPAVELALTQVQGTVDPFEQPYPCYVLLELSSSAMASGLTQQAEAALMPLFENGLLLDAVIANSGQQTQQLWFMREAIVEAQRLAGASVKHDVSVPLAAIPELLTQATAAVQAILPSVRVLPFGHVGDGNIHFNLVQPADMSAAEFSAFEAQLSDAVHAVVAQLGGSVSAEHGIGQLRCAVLQQYGSPVGLQLMQQFKQLLDPKNLMNPHKVLG